MEKEKYELSALDAYINRVYKFAVLFVPILCLCAGGTITILNGLNLYPVANTVLLAVFDFSALIYLLIGIYFSKTGYFLSKSLDTICFKNRIWRKWSCSAGKIEDG